MNLLEVSPNKSDVGGKKVKTAKAHWEGAKRMATPSNKARSITLIAKVVTCKWFSGLKFPGTLTRARGDEGPSAT